MSDDLVVFLRARLDEDEQAARSAMGVNLMADRKRGKPVPRWQYQDDGSIRDGENKDRHPTVRVKFTWAREADHIIRHDPVRVLAEVDAKRRIIDRYTSAVEDSAEDADGYYDENRFEDARQLVPVLRLLALPYADHPDYRPEWAPSA